MKRNKKDIFLAIVGVLLILMLLSGDSFGFVTPNNSFAIGQDIGVLVLYIAGLAAIKKVLLLKKPAV
ncbi:MAG: hypothetical protein NUV61_01625 [Candidatus Azambacteria bacterium]|nr:hypothetical protein [Candidatus Azambacteria bacterium]